MPNILYIYADQHRAPFLGCYGQDAVLTPHVDALAASGVLFENCFTNSPLCRPARATMMTGQLPHVHGSWSNNYIADRLGESHVRRMRDAGWKTAMFGKAHLDLLNGDTRSPRNLQRLEEWGFVDVMELLSQPHTSEHANPYSAYLRETTAPGRPAKDLRYKKYVAEWDYVTNNVPPDEAPYYLEKSDHLDVFCGRRAADWIRQQDGSEPFYLQVNFPGPHKPFDAPSEYLERYEVADMPLPILGAPEGAGVLVDYLHRSKPELQGHDEATYRRVMLSYFAKISLIDDMVGEVLAALDEMGLTDDTWIVYSSDHGELVGDHELWGKVAMYEGSLRIPFVIRPPGGLAAPARVSGMIDQRDVTQTLLAIGGDSSGGGGEPLLDLVLDPSRAAAFAGREQIVAMVEGHFVNGLRTGMIRTARHKLVVDLDDRRNDVLYDLEADPDERVNRIANPGYQAVVKDLRARFDDELEAARE